MRETGWLIEAENHSLYHEWLSIRILSGQGVIEWTKDASEALRFARRGDAVGFAWLHKEHCTLALVTEHVWIESVWCGANQDRAAAAAVASGRPKDAT